MVEYSRIRGIRVILEVDAPTHVYAGWNQISDDYDKIIICGEKDPFNSHLNPDNPNVLKFLKSIYADLLELGSDSEYFHIGADEVNTSCLKKTKSINKYHDVLLLWGSYINDMVSALKLAHNNTLPKYIAMWSSDLTNSDLNILNFKNQLVVQFWLGDIQAILSHGIKVVFSTVGHWYLDCGYGPWRPHNENGPCGPYTTWQEFYKYRPWSDMPQYVKLVLGGEACLWTETVVPDSFEVRLWPRAAAMAERLWSDPVLANMEDVFFRLSSHRERIVARKIKADAIWPMWCQKNPGRCN